LGISSCLLGAQVRWDGGNKRDQWLAEQLGRIVQYYPVCPEMECGFGVPRDPLCLVGDPRAPRLVTSRTKQDRTRRMLQWARRRLRELERADLDGFIFKGGSPSCGTKGIRVYDIHKKKRVASRGQGVFARAFMEHFPLIPVEGDGRLHDPKLRENFLERCLVIKKWRETLRQHRRSRSPMMQFHTDHKLSILSHSPRHYRIMEELVARAEAMPTVALYAKYQQLLMGALHLKTTPAKHVQVLQHVKGYFRTPLSGDERKELQELIDLYRQGQVPLSVPISRINHYARRFGNACLQQQSYLLPEPLHLQLFDLL
jgi:uncharacterized protein YbgA (DUF1722 family)/uncharacterized protein YbbK (DUF523 family)